MPGWEVRTEGVPPSGFSPPSAILEDVPLAGTIEGIQCDGLAGHVRHWPGHVELERHAFDVADELHLVDSTRGTVRRCGVEGGQVNGRQGITGAKEE